MEVQKNHFDAIVIGSGPGGEGAAIKLAKSGKTVAIVENHLLVGGGCTHLGTIPSKSFIHVVRKYADEKKNRLFDRGRHPARVTCDDLMTAMQKVIDNQVRDREDFY
jgi:NAD(P) transhydrogenase